jgi:hypothetical protein
MKNLINRSQLTFEKIEKLSICQQINSYRQTLNMNQDVSSSASCSSSSSSRISEGLSKILQTTRSQLRRDDDVVVDDIMESIPFGFSSSSSIPPMDTTTTTAMNQSVDIQPIDEYGATYDDYGDVDFQAGNDYDFVNETMKEDGEGEGEAISTHLKKDDDEELLGVGMKLRWSVNDDDNNRNQQETDQLAASLDRQVQVEVKNNKRQSGGNPLNDGTFTTFINIDEISSSSNAWAGAAHWKYGNKRATSMKSKTLVSKSQSQSIDENEATSSTTLTEEGNEKKGTKKATTISRKRGTIGNTNVLSFTKERIDDSKFGKMNGKTDSTLLSKNVLEKMKKDAINLLLPDDEKVTVKDLCRLFLLPNYIVNPSPSGKKDSFFSQYFTSLQEKKQKQLSSTSSTAFTKSKVELLMESLDGVEDKFFNAGSVSSFAKKNDAVMEDFGGSNDMVGSCAASNDDYYDDNYYEPPVADDMPSTRYEVTGTADGDQTMMMNEIDMLPIEGLKIDSSRFVQADRKVSKIEIK